jgi:hypothetical protein
MEGRQGMNSIQQRAPVERPDFASSGQDVGFHNHLATESGI